MYSALCREVGVGGRRLTQLEPRLGGGLLRPGPVPDPVHRPRRVGHPRPPRRSSAHEVAQWHYPNRPGATHETWVDAVELSTARDLVGAGLVHDPGGNRVRPGPAAGQLRRPDPEGEGERRRRWSRHSPGRGSRSRRCGRSCCRRSAGSTPRPRPDDGGRVDLRRAAGAPGHDPHLRRRGHLPDTRRAERPAATVPPPGVLLAGVGAGTEPGSCSARPPRYQHSTGPSGGSGVRSRSTRPS